MLKRELYSPPNFPLYFFLSIVPNFFKEEIFGYGMANWNLKDIYDFKQTENFLNDLRNRVEKFKAYRQELPKLTPERFMQIIREAAEIDMIGSRLIAYAELKLSENTADSTSLAHYSKISELSAELGNEMLFFSLWFKNLDDKTALLYLNKSGEYRYYLERIRVFRKYTLGESEERIITLKDLTGDEALVSIYDQICSQFTFSWKGKTITQEELIQYVRSPKKAERKQAYDLLLTRYKDEKVLGELYKYLVTSWRNENIKIRGFASSISPRNLGNNIPDSSVETLLSVVKDNMHIFHDYFELKANILKLGKMSRYDLYAPYPSKRKKYSYDESKKMVLSTLAAFSPEMKRMAEQIFKESHVHSEIQHGKRSGAFCYSVLPSISPYILLNHTGTLDTVFTMIHEFGHGVHSLAAKDKTIYTFQAPLPLAETASVFGEMLLAQELLKKGNREEKIAILLRNIDGQYATIGRQAQFVLFEKEAHEMIAKGATVEELNKRYYSLLQEMFGPRMTIPEIFTHEWKYIPHIYHTPFYCYAYAFGNLLVLSLYKKYQEEGELFIPKYLALLAAGGSEPPEKMLSKIGININSREFWEEGFSIIEDEITLLKSLLAEQKSKKEGNTLKKKEMH
jgi:oligoendopeptidase F